MSAPILVGYERTESADRALTHAIALAHEKHAPLLVLAVHEAPLDPTGPRAFGTLGDGTPMQGPFPELPDLHEVLHEARDKVNAGGVKHATYAWAIGEPGGLIVETAKDHHCLMVVVGRAPSGAAGHGCAGQLQGIRSLGLTRPETLAGRRGVTGWRDTRSVP